MKYSDKNKPLVCMMTQSTCYKGTRKFTPKGVLWHSTGANNPWLKRYVQPDDNAADRAEWLNRLGKNQYNNDWNHIDHQAGLNFWIGKLADGTVAAVQTMPWDYRPWGCGSGSKGSCNNTHIQFEICEDGLNDKSYWEAVYKEACEMTAYLCKMFGINPKGTTVCNGVTVPTIIDHTGSHSYGLGSNHGDVQHWSRKYGVTMDTVRNDVVALEDGLEATNSLADGLLYKRVTYIDRSSTVASPAFATTRRWFLTSVFPSDCFIDSFKYYMDQKSVATALTVEVWTLVGGTLTKVKSITVTDFTEYSENVVPIGYNCTTPVMISFLSTQSVVYIDGGDQNIHIYSCQDTSPSTTTLSVDSLTDFGAYSPSVTVVTTIAKASDIVAYPANVVTVGTGMDYSEIQDALNAIVDDSESKPYTILVMPRGTPYQRFSTIRQFSQAYTWDNISPRYVSIVGVDKKHCVIKSDSGNYKLPCGEPMTNGMIKNLTFIMTNNDQDPNATQGGYCLHIDCRTLNDIGYDMVIEDCDFEDASGPCLGIGMHKNCTLTIRRCNFKTTLSANYSPHEGYTNLYNYGVIFCHSSTRADSTNQRISFEDCFGVCAEGNKSLWLSTAGDYDPSTASFYYRLLRNVFWNETENAPAYSIESTLTAEPYNFGNNIPSS